MYSLSVIGERWWTYRRSRIASATLARRAFDRVDEGKIEQALAPCEASQGGHLAAVLGSGLRELLPLESANPGLHGGPELERTRQFRGDAQVSYGLVIEIVDTLKAAGIETVGMITERSTRAARP